MRLASLAAPLAGVVLAGVLFVATRGLDQVAQPGQLGPGFWPRLVLAGLGLSCLVKLVLAWRARSATASAGAALATERPAISRARLAGGVGLIVLYVALAGPIGFALATALFIAGFMGLAGARSLPGLAANAVLGTVGLLYLFVRFVYLPLPKGDGPFETLTIALYRALRLF